LIGFGTRMQVAGLIPLARDQVLSVAVAAVAGVAALGLWSLAYRAIQVPLVVSHSLWRVAFPTLARLPRPAAAGELEREAAIVAVATGAVGAALAASGPSLLPALVGERWEPVAPALLWTGLGIVAGTPGYVVGFGWLASADRADRVLRISMLQALGSLLVALVLLSSLGVTAAGLAWLVHSTLGAWLCEGDVRRDTGARMARAVVIPVGAYLIVAGTGYAAAKILGSSLLGGAGVVMGTEAVAVLVLILFPSGRRLLRESARLTRRAVRDATRRDEPPLLPT
jgi:O-antigen/teichoic acid export membrane protein